MAASLPPVVGYLLFAAADVPEPAALLDALGAHSPTVEPDLPYGCWLDLRGGKRGPTIEQRAAAVVATAREWGYIASRLGVAPTPGVARLAAQRGSQELTLLSETGTVTAFLGPLTLEAVGLDATTADHLALVGLRTLGDVAALPRGALGDHLGPGGPALEALARGEDDRPLVSTRPPLVLTARRELDWALDDRAQLVALIDDLLGPLLAHLRRQGLGATRATLTFGTGAGQSTIIPVALAAPTTRVIALRDTLLATLPPDHDTRDGVAGISTVAVALSAPRPVLGRQTSFFDVPQGRAGLLQRGVTEARRRSDAPLGHLRLVDPGHPLPEQRYALEELPPDGAAEAAT